MTDFWYGVLAASIGYLIGHIGAAAILHCINRSRNKKTRLL